MTCKWTWCKLSALCQLWSCTACFTPYLPPFWVAASGYWIVPESFFGAILSVGQGDHHRQIRSEAGDSRWSCAWEQGMSPISSVWYPQLLLCLMRHWVFVAKCDWRMASAPHQDINGPEDLWATLTVSTFFRGHVAGAAPLITPAELFLSFVIVMCIPLLRVLWARYRIIVILFGASVLLFCCTRDVYFAEMLLP